VATVNKDFRVKHGIAVAEGGTFGGTVTVATPAGLTAPVSPSNGGLWFDTLTERLHVYYSGEWYPMATLEDAEVLQDHIHDTAIDGSGLIVSTFISGGAYNEPGVLVSAGLYNTASFEATYDGGTAIDNFN
jgi:hypothetical protein